MARHVRKLRPRQAALNEGKLRFTGNYVAVGSPSDIAFASA